VARILVTFQDRHMFGRPFQIPKLVKFGVGGRNTLPIDEKKMKKIMCFDNQFMFRGRSRSSNFEKYFSKIENFS